MFKRLVLLTWSCGLLNAECSFAQMGSSLQGIWHLKGEGVFEDLKVKDNDISQESGACKYAEIVVALSETRILFEMSAEDCGGLGGDGHGISFLRPVEGKHYKEIYRIDSRGEPKVVGRLQDNQILLQEITFVGGYYMKEKTFRLDRDYDGTLSFVISRTESDPGVTYFDRRSHMGVLAGSSKNIAAYKKRLAESN